MSSGDPEQPVRPIRPLTSRRSDRVVTADNVRDGWREVRTARGSGMDAFGVLKDVLGDYESFVRGLLNIRDPEILARVEGEIENGLL